MITMIILRILIIVTIVKLLVIIMVILKLKMKRKRSQRNKTKKISPNESIIAQHKNVFILKYKKKSVLLKKQSKSF